MKFRLLAFAELRRRLAFTLSALLVLQVLGAIPNKTIESASAAVANCTTSQFTITAKHNSVFYFDNGTDITSGYAQYEIVNKSNNTGPYWAKLENFTGGALALARFENATRSLGTIATNGTSNQYWYLTASAISSTTQAHDVVIYSSDPSSGGGTAVCKLNRSFSRTESTIASSANKVTSVEYSSLPTANADGSATFTATVKGQTGTIGQGPTKNYDVNLNPATHKDFAVGNYRLSGTSYQCTGGSAVTGTLYIPNACEGNYTAIFTYQYLSSTFESGTLKSLSPIMQISSGTQMKHTSTPSFTIADIGTVAVPKVTTVGATVMTTTSVRLNGTRDVGTFTSYYFCWSQTDPGSSFSNPANCTTTANATSGTPYDFLDINSGLTTGKYFFEFIGVTSDNTKYYGGVKNFSILIPEVVDTTTAATSITTNSAILNGEQANLAAADFAGAFFVYSTTSPSGYSAANPQRNYRLDPYANETLTVSATSPYTNFSATLSDLSPSTKYYFELVLVDTATAQYFGGIVEFTTAAAVNYTVTFDPNGGDLASNNAVDTVTVTSGTDALLSKPNPSPTRSGYTFLGWNTSNSATTALNSYTVTGTVTLYAVWQSSGGGGGGGGGAPPPPPPPPVISNLSRSLVCALSAEITINGANFDGAKVTLNDVEITIKSASSNALVVALPAGDLGVKTLKVTTAYGSTTASINYVTNKKPKFEPLRIPYLSQGVAMSLDLIAQNATSFRLNGRLPSGVNFDLNTGLISGTPTENGVFVFDVIAVGVCGETLSVLELDIDAPTPNAKSHRINFLPNSCEITDSQKQSFLKFIEEIKGLSPRNIIPDIYISGGYKNSDPNSPLAQCRQENLCGVLLVEDLLGEVLTDVFTGNENRIEIIVYWERPNDDEI